MKSSLAILCLCFGAACVTQSASYTPPIVVNEASNYSCVVDRSYDEVWDDLIEYAAGTYFAIDNFEKDSGLLTLSFGASEPGEFVDGGDWKFDAANHLNGQSFNFEGNYVDYLALRFNGKLTGRMNIVVKPKASGGTFVTVNARYVFSTDSFDPTNGRRWSDTWTFNTGGSAEVAISIPSPGTGSTRTLRPTYKAENAILSAVRGTSRR